MQLRLAGSSFGYLHHRSLEDALADLADHGLAEVELTTMPPHLHLPAVDAYRRRALRRELERRGLACVSVNPGYVDINVVSVYAEFRELSLRFVEQGLELAHELGAPWTTLVSGRLHGLAPVDGDAARSVLEDGLGRLLARADALGVGIALENSPFGFMGRAADVLAVADALDHPRLALCYDVASAVAQEDPAAGIRTIGRRLGLVHLSDSSRDRFAHTSPGRGDVDFAEVAAALAGVAFAGPTVYELVDGEDPAPRLADDLRSLARHGWHGAARRS